MRHMERTGWTLIITVAVVLAARLTVAEPPGRSFCGVPDNGTGTGEVPPVGCSYISPAEVFMIIDGLPPGTTMTRKRNSISVRKRMTTPTTMTSKGIII